MDVEYLQPRNLGVTSTKIVELVDGITGSYKKEIDYDVQKKLEVRTIARRCSNVMSFPNLRSSFKIYRHEITLYLYEKSANYRLLDEYFVNISEQTRRVTEIRRKGRSMVNFADGVPHIIVLIRGEERIVLQDASHIGPMFKTDSSDEFEVYHQILKGYDGKTPDQFPSANSIVESESHLV